MTQRTLFSLALVALFILGGLLWPTRPTQTVAQDGAPPDTLRGLLLALEGDETLFTVDFGNTVPRLGKSIDVGPGQPTTLARIGADVVCFRVTATTVVQITCVPYSNVNAVFYAE